MVSASHSIRYIHGNCVESVKSLYEFKKMVFCSKTEYSAIDLNSNRNSGPGQLFIQTIDDVRVRFFINTNNK